MIEFKLKTKIISLVATALLSVLSYFFGDPFVRLMETVVCVPFYVFPMVVAVSVVIPFFLRWLNLLLCNKKLKFMRSIIKNGSVFGISNGEDNVTAIEWSWISPAYLIASTRNGVRIKVHYSLIQIYA